MQLNSGGNLLYICVPREFVDFPFYCLFVCSWKPIINYINEQYDNYFRDESGLNRRNLEDHRVHCCLYFISPSTHG